MMGMSNQGLKLLNSIIRDMAPSGELRRVLALGYPDILASPAELLDTLGPQIFERLQFREDAAEIIAWHKVGDLTDRIASTESLFTAWGMELEVSDIVEARGGELILDLNEPCAEHLHGRYHLIIDSGTLEHCFNIGQAARNVANLTAVGGYILHGNPLNMLNHGFYNLNPTWYADFYQDNGFDIVYLKAMSGTLRDAKVHEVPMYKRFVDVPADSTMNCIVRKRRQRPVRWPVQTKYKRNPTLKGKKQG
ncbi:MAG: hypothetical protein QM800_06625 [Paludibacter sp.]